MAWNKQDASDLFDQSVDRYWNELEEGDLEIDQRRAVVNELLSSFLRISAIVEKLGLFSPKNETLEDIKTLDVKFLLTSFYLGQLFSRIPASPPSDPSQMATMHEIRKKNIRNAKAQLDVFLNRCEQLQIMSLRDSEYWSRIAEGSDKQMDASARRTEKIERLRRKQALDREVEELRSKRDHLREKLGLKTLEDMERSSEFEEIERNFQISRINQAIMQAIDDVIMHNEEAKMLDGFLQQQQQQHQQQCGRAADSRVASRLLAGKSNGGDRPGSGVAPRKPQLIETTPAAIERQGGIRFNKNGPPTLIRLTPSDAANVAPSASLSAHEFRQQKLREMFTPRNPPTASLADYAEQEMRELQLREARDREAAKEREIPEEEMDRDEHVDRETYKAREWDDWKDANPRGVGRLPQ